jgi:hypothetical protein
MWFTIRVRNAQNASNKAGVSYVPPDAALADLRKKERDEWEALVFLEELGILVLSQPLAASRNKPAETTQKGAEVTETPKAA